MFEGHRGFVGDNEKGWAQTVGMLHNLVNAFNATELCRYKWIKW